MMPKNGTTTHAETNLPIIDKDALIVSLSSDNSNLRAKVTELESRCATLEKRCSDMLPEAEYCTCGHTALYHRVAEVWKLSGCMGKLCGCRRYQKVTLNDGK